MSLLKAGSPVLCHCGRTIKKYFWKNLEGRVAGELQVLRRSDGNWFVADTVSGGLDPRPNSPACCPKSIFDQAVPSYAPRLIFAQREPTGLLPVHRSVV